MFVISSSVCISSLLFYYDLSQVALSSQVIGRKDITRSVFDVWKEVSQSGCQIFLGLKWLNTLCKNVISSYLNLSRYSRRGNRSKAENVILVQARRLIHMIPFTFWFPTGRWCGCRQGTLSFLQDLGDNFDYDDAGMIMN